MCMGSRCALHYLCACHLPISPSVAIQHLFLHISHSLSTIISRIIRTAAYRDTKSSACNAESSKVTHRYLYRSGNVSEVHFALRQLDEHKEFLLTAAELRCLNSIISVSQINAAL